MMKSLLTMATVFALVLAFCLVELIILIITVLHATEFLEDLIRAGREVIKEMNAAQQAVRDIITQPAAERDEVKAAFTQIRQDADAKLKAANDKIDELTADLNDAGQADAVESVAEIKQIIADLPTSVTNALPAPPNTQAQAGTATEEQTQQP